MRVLNRSTSSRVAQPTEVLPPGVQRRQRAFWRRPWVLIVVVVLGLVSILANVILSTRDATVAEQKTDTTQQQLGAVSDPLAELCRTDPAVRVRVGDAACGLAQQAVDNPEIPTPGAPGADGAAGVAGRGIVSTTLVDGSLQVRYSDGSNETVGRVVGVDGVPGTAGRDGVGITGSQIADGRLVLSFSDGTTRDVGQVVGSAGVTGAQGEAGPAGADGRGVESVEQADGRLRVTYSDGVVQDLGPLPAGPAGADGSPATSLVLQGAGPLGADLTCTRSNDDATAPVYTCQ